MTVLLQLNRSDDLEATSKHILACIQNSENAASLPQVNSYRQQPRLGQDTTLGAMLQCAPTEAPRISMNTDNAPPRLRRNLHAGSLYRRHPRAVQNLSRGDQASRVQFCKWLQPRIQILSAILFTDQARFTREAVNNRTYSHPRLQQNPQGMVQSNFSKGFFFSFLQTCGTEFWGSTYVDYIFLATLTGA